MTDRWCLAQVCGSVAPRMSVAGSPRRSPSCRWRKRHRPGADWWGPPVRFIVDQGCGYLFTCFGIFLLVLVLWCVGNPDLWDRGLVCFWGTFLLWLVYPNLPIAWAQARARITGYQPQDFPTRLRPSTTSSMMSTPRSQRSVVDES